MAEVGRKPFARKGDAFDSLEGTLGEGQSTGEVGIGSQSGGELVS